LSFKLSVTAGKFIGSGEKGGAKYEESGLVSCRFLALSERFGRPTKATSFGG
jgi:hypothetical protein